MNRLENNDGIIWIKNLSEKNGNPFMNGFSRRFLRVKSSCVKQNQKIKLFHNNVHEND